MAVQLGAVSLWLATLLGKAADLLDHHLVAGNSLVGATFEDVLRQPTASRRHRRPSLLPLFDHASLDAALQQAAATRIRLALDPDDTPADVTNKERALTALQDPASPLGRWSRLFDLWCSGWFWEQGSPPDARMFADLCDHLLHRGASLPARLIERPLGHAADVARRHHFFHWPLMFPEVFSSGGNEGHHHGFDAVVGNPPWDMVRGDSGSGEIRETRKRDAQRISNFGTRGWHLPRRAARSHQPLSAVPRARLATRPCRRASWARPAGRSHDRCRRPMVRRHLFDHAAVDAVTGLDNREGIFPIHRSLKFALVTATNGAATESVRCRFGLTSTDALEKSPSTPLVLTRAFLRRLSGEDDLGVPEIVAAQDLRIIEAIGTCVPWLGATDGWNAHFGRELHASEDRGSFRPFTGRHGARPVFEGKQIEPFRTSLDACRHELDGAFTSNRLVRRKRVAYRDVASATNRLTLIAAVIPARAVTTHTLFCLRRRRRT